MNRIDKYCIAFSCFFINFLHLLKNAFAFGFKRKYVLVETQGRFPEASGEAARKCHGFGTRSCGGGYSHVDLRFSVWHHFYGVISCVSRCDS